MKKIQIAHQIVDISDWLRNEEVYPVGKRVKSLVYCPSISPFDFLEAGHGYMFKQSPVWAPEQFWVEIFAYHLGFIMGVDVPIAFVAIDSKRDNRCGALIRWFLESPKTSLENEEFYISGGDIYLDYIENFDRKSGEQHNFETVMQIFEGFDVKYSSVNTNWLECWVKILIFDALIGNTDRHQDNWGIIEKIQYDVALSSGRKTISISPAFDNGSSMGYEKKPHQLVDEKSLERYVLRGEHHMKWCLSDSSRARHVNDLTKKLINKYPVAREIMLKCLQRVSPQAVKAIIDEMLIFDLPVKLSTERANFMLKLLNFRYQRLLDELRSR